MRVGHVGHVGRVGRLGRLGRQGRGAAQLGRLVAAVRALRHAVARVVHGDALAAALALELVAAAAPCFILLVLPLYYCNSIRRYLFF